jgi:hypothetical protein
VLKTRLGALALAALTIGLLATPASAAQSVTRFRGKDATVLATNCNFRDIGSKCTGWVVLAAQQRVKSDGTVTKSASLELDKYRLTIIDVGVVDAKFLSTGVSDHVSLSIPADLSTASGHASVPSLVGSVSVSFSLTANAPADYVQTRTVEKFGDCKIIDRSNFYQRTADGSATIAGRTFPTTRFFPSTIDLSTDTTIFRNCS